MIYLLMTALLPQYRKMKVFEELKEQSAKLMLLDFSELLDNEINKIYLPELEKTLLSIQENQKYQSEARHKEALESVAQILETVRKNEGNLKWGGEAARKLSQHYSQ